MDLLFHGKLEHVQIILRNVENIKSFNNFRLSRNNCICTIPKKNFQFQNNCHVLNGIVLNAEDAT